ncbi:DUF1187 family protein [Salmonella enterica]|uniref:DUF1187 family protein n=1 Tax=Enterobacteriaceae TaxID=543 RepID=UPI002EF9328E|nr:DUF1187 family protein [Salmonella enterica]EKC2356374.1 DUF1187 family protein [Salmonella enterica]EKC2383948.1 DUF1187 family protein [Salmonella enterica]EKC2505648.1 DUF1187 family protein [Salmonella enterica]EKC2519977.1 DUF1187 family protein [Salmonella enterica]
MYRITAVINKAGGAPVSWTFYSGRRMTLEQCETMLSRDREAGRHNGFRVTLTEFLCEKVDNNFNVTHKVAQQCSIKVKKGVKPKNISGE